MTKKEEKKYPVVKCFVSGKYQVKFWCPFCQLWHYHGSCNGGDWSGHRAAHCAKHTPFKDSGYILKPYTKTELKEMGFTDIRNVSITQDL